MNTKQSLQLSNVSVIESVFAKQSVSSAQQSPKYFAVWSSEKNALLRANRNISFEKVVAQIEKGGLLNIVEHHNPTKYPTQRILIVAIESYVYLVPFVQSDTKVMLKTVYPSRKATRKYLPRVAQVAV